MKLQSSDDFNRWVHRFGITTSLLLFAGMTAFPLAASAIYGVWPDFKQLLPGFAAAVLFMAPWWPAETIGYMPVMGPGALYMSYITGNVTNLRMPATVGTINSMGIEPNTDACHTIAIIACGASIITTVSIMALGVVMALPLQPILEAPVLKPAFDFVIPAIFGGLVAQTIFKCKKDALLYLFPLAICLFFCYFTNINGSYYMLIGIAASVGIYIASYKKESHTTKEVTNET